MPGKGKRLPPPTEPQSARLREAQLSGGVRHSHDQADEKAVVGVTKPAIRRIARRGGVKRVSERVYAKTRRLMNTYLTRILCEANLYADYAERKTITVKDVLCALRRRNEAIYGYGTWSEQTGLNLVKPPPVPATTKHSEPGSVAKKRKHRHSITGFERKTPKL